MSYNLLNASLTRLRFGLQEAIEALLPALAGYALIVFLAFLISDMGYPDSISLGVVHIASISGFYIFWRNGRWGRARFDSFGAALILLSLAYRGQALIDLFFFGTRVDDIYRYPVPMPDDVFLLFLKSESVAFIGTLLVAVTWRLSVADKVESYSPLINVKSAGLTLSVLIYPLALVIDLASRIFGVGFGPLDQFAGTFFILGVASIYFISTQRQAALIKLLVAVLLAIPMVFLALSKGMKSEIFFPLIPALIIFFSEYKSKVLRAGFVGFGLITLIISQAYVHHVRGIAWDQEGVTFMPAPELIGSFLDDLPYMDPLEVIDSTSSRVNMTQSRAITVTLADHNGAEPGNIFSPIPATFIPRFLWQNKPVLQPGAEHTARVLNLNVDTTQIRSATAAGFTTELYLGGYWWGVIAGSIVFGLLVAFSQRVVLSWMPGFGHLALCFVAFFWALRFSEKHVVYAFTGVVFILVFLVLLGIASKLAGIRSIREVPQQTAPKQVLR